MIRNTAALPPALHFHAHLPQGETFPELHLHLHWEPSHAQERERERPDHARGITQPGAGAPWNVRPYTSGGTVGYICAVGNEPSGLDEIWGYVFSADPGSNPAMPPEAVCGFVDPNTGNWFFRHDKTPPGFCAGSGSGGSGRLGTEIPNATCTSTGVTNWLVLWVKRGGVVTAIHQTTFLGICATSTSCGGQQEAEEPTGGGEVTAPLPACFRVQMLPEATRPGRQSRQAKPIPPSAPVELHYVPGTPCGKRPMWRSACGRWTMEVVKVPWALAAIVRGTGLSIGGKTLDAAWSGVIVPGVKRQVFCPVSAAGAAAALPGLAVECA